MADYVTLMGADDVRSAGSAMRSAAEDMRSVASSIDSTFERHQRFLDDWLQRFEAAIERASKPDPKPDNRTQDERDYDLDRYSAR
jgi:hypothetical protein